MLLDRDPPVNWKAILLDFIRWGWTLKGVALAINVAPSTLMGWWNDGSVPTYENGRALLKLHAAETEKRKSAPPPGNAALQTSR